jgi:hypothetical protein
MTLPYELIDAVISEKDDGLSRYIHSNLVQLNAPDVEQYSHLEKLYTLPTAQYLYFDLAALLTAECIFIWEDKKYGKRLFRWIFMALAASIRDNHNIVVVDNIVKGILMFIEDMSTLTSIHHKLDAITNMFTIKDNKIVLTTGKYDNPYFKRILINYLQCIVCASYVLGNQKYKGYCDEVFKYSINYKEVPGTMFLTKKFDIYTSHDQLYYFELVSELERYMMEYLGQIVKVIRHAVENNQNIVSDNIIIAL